MIRFLENEPEKKDKGRFGRNRIASGQGAQERLEQETFSSQEH